MNDTIDVEAEQQAQEPVQALTVRDAVTALDKPLDAPKAAITAAQAKIDAVANLTAKAYDRASQLSLTPEEIKALQAPFPDEAFKPGAAGKESLIYIEHAFLRDRLNEVIGPGQWALIPRSRWAEDFVTSKGQPASRVYVEAMLMIRGCFVAEAVGEMEYWKNNASQNYGDAVEGAKTAALRRCCKEFGIGLQAWKKDWCAGWWQRKKPGNGQKLPPPQTPPKQQAPAAPQQRPDGEGEEFPTVTVLTVKEVHSKPDAPKKWTAYFVRFSDGFGELEAATFDKKIADLANELASTQENARLATRPGRKPGSKEIVKLERTEVPPEPTEPPQADNQPEDLIP